MQEQEYNNRSVQTIPECTHSQQNKPDNWWIFLYIFTEGEAYWSKVMHTIFYKFIIYIHTMHSIYFRIVTYNILVGEIWMVMYIYFTVHKSTVQKVT